LPSGQCIKFNCLFNLVEVGLDKSHFKS